MDPFSQQSTVFFSIRNNNCCFKLCKIASFNDLVLNWSHSENFNYFAALFEANFSILTPLYSGINTSKSIFRWQGTLFQSNALNIFDSDKVTFPAILLHIIQEIDLLL